MLSATQLTCILTTRLGFIINYRKLKLTPTQLLTYLGAILDLHPGVISPTVDGVNNLVKCTSRLASSKEASAQAWLCLLSLMASLVDLVPLCRLQMRPLQLHLLSYFRPKSDSFNLQVPVTPFISPLPDC